MSLSNFNQFFELAMNNEEFQQLLFSPSSYSRLGAIELIIICFILVPIIFLLTLPIFIMKALAYRKAGEQFFTAFIPVYTSYVMSKITFGKERAWIGVLTWMWIIFPILLIPITIILSKVIFFCFCLSFDIHPALAGVGIILPIIPLCVIIFRKKTCTEKL